MEINHTIRKKFMMVSLVIGILLVGVQTFFFRAILENIHESDEQYSESVITQMNLAINKSFQNIRSIAWQLSLGSNIENYLLPENDFELYQDHQYFKQSINTMILCDEHILDIALYRSDSRIMYHYLKDDAELNQVLAYNRSYFEGEEQVPSFRVIYNEEKTISYIVYVQPVKFLSRATTRWKEQIGCLLIFLDDVLINDILTERDTDIISGVYLLDSQDMIVNGVGEQICETKQEELEIQPIAETGWKIGYALNDTTLFKRYIMLRYMVAASVMIAVILFFALFFICNYYIVRPVFDLHRQIAFVTSGGLSKRIHMERRDEIGSIAKVINTMLDHQMEISYRMLHTQQDLYEAELKEKENELRILENQVNPHFILNTLQCICGIATTYNAQEVVDIATAMGKIFEYSLRAPENVTLRQEMNIVQEYLEIVDIRFENRFIWDMDIQEELLDARMPKMILQPLVENAIYHGLEKKGRGIVQIFCEEGEGGLWIHIWDNGAGIEAKKLEKIKEFLQDEREMHRISMKVKRIGIANTCLRIKNFFGSAYGIEIDSIEGSGTEVTIHMSLEREERDKSRFCQ
jgi:sensor histidine kinase YesM